MGDNRLSWGKLFDYPHKAINLHWLPTAHDLKGMAAHAPLLAFGKGRSYGDSCLIENGSLLHTRSLDHFLHFDPITGILRCESGVTLADILELVVPHGWFLPVVPGTKFVTIGGAIANDVHGKNHGKQGTIGRHVRAFGLLRTDRDSHLTCTAHENGDLFAATIGGLGLTGFITWVEIQLIKGAPLLDVEHIRFRGLNEFLAINQESKKFTYTVAWVDSVGRGRNMGRGTYIRGNHIVGDVSPKDNYVVTKPRVSVPFYAPSWLLNRWSISAFNHLIYHKELRSHRRLRSHFESFFFPLDSIGDWNRIYGKRGLYQYQFVVPLDAVEAVQEAQKRIAESGLASFLVVLKTFGELTSPGMLSFPRPGITLSLDFPNVPGKIETLFGVLDKIILDANGRLYPAKDAAMSAAMFEAGYPNWRDFQRHIDPQFSSSFWRRVTHGRS